MASNSWNQTFAVAQSDGTALTNTTTATSLLPAHAKYTMPGGMSKPGDVWRVRAAGRISTAASTPGTFTFDVRAGTTTVVFNGGASGTLATSASNLTWWLEILMTVRAVGTSGNLLGTGCLTSAALSATTPVMLLPASSPAVGSNVDLTTGGFQWDLYGTWSVASASNTITLHQYELALLT